MTPIRSYRHTVVPLSNYNRSRLPEYKAMEIGVEVTGHSYEANKKLEGKRVLVRALQCRDVTPWIEDRRSGGPEDRKTGIPV